MGMDQAYAGLHLLRVGDLLQLKPVANSWIFTKKQSDIWQRPWQTDMHMFELTEIVRQDNADFQNLLNRVREGKHTLADLQVLQATSRNVPLTQPHLMYTNASKDKHNEEVIQDQDRAGVAIHTYAAVHQVLGIQMSSHQKQKVLAAGQKRNSETQEVRVCVGIPVEFTFNMDKADGLINGTFGTIKAIDDAGVVWVHFTEARVGRQARQHHNPHPADHQHLWTPIHRVNRDFKSAISLI